MGRVTKKTAGHDANGQRATAAHGLIAPASDIQQDEPATLAAALEEIRALEKELAWSREESEAERYRYRELFDLNPDAYLITDKNGVIFDANLAASTLLGVATQFLANKPLAVYVLMEDRSMMREAINRMAQVDHFELTVRIDPRRLPVRTVYIRVAATRDETGGPLKSIRWIIRDVTEARIAQEEVAASRERLRELTSELSLAEERVRREIAVGIHDRVSQPLALVKILLGKVKLSATGKQGREIDELSGLVQQAIDESRTLTFELSPPILYELGLPSAVEWLGEQMQRRHGVKIRTKARLFNGHIPLELRVLLFQSIRELLTNVIKHAKAQSAGVSLRLENGEVQIVVSDDGVGFDSSSSWSPPSHPGGFGLFSIRTRVERVGGQFLLESKPGRGTRVTLVVPILPEAIDEGTGDAGQPAPGTSPG